MYKIKIDLAIETTDELIAIFRHYSSLGIKYEVTQYISNSGFPEVELTGEELSLRLVIDDYSPDDNGYFDEFAERIN